MCVSGISAIKVGISVLLGDDPFETRIRLHVAFGERKNSCLMFIVILKLLLAARHNRQKNKKRCFLELRPQGGSTHWVLNREKR